MYSHCYFWCCCCCCCGCCYYRWQRRMVLFCVSTINHVSFGPFYIEACRVHIEQTCGGWRMRERVCISGVSQATLNVDADSYVYYYFYNSDANVEYFETNKSTNYSNNPNGLHTHTRAHTHTENHGTSISLPIYSNSSTISFHIHMHGDKHSFFSFVCSLILSPAIKLPASANTLISFTRTHIWPFAIVYTLGKQVHFFHYCYGCCCAPYSQQNHVQCNLCSQNRRTTAC